MRHVFSITKSEYRIEPDLSIFSILSITKIPHTPSTNNQMNIKILGLLVSLSLLVMTSGTKTQTWFREKYLQNTYDEYYDYTLTRYKLEDNNRDICPDTHKSSLFFAITGQHMNRIKRTCSTIYVQKSTNIDRSAHYTPPKSHYVQHIEVTIMDVLYVLGEFVCYTFEISMLIMSVILASCSTLFLIMLLFCQY